MNETGCTTIGRWFGRLITVDGAPAQRTEPVRARTADSVSKEKPVSTSGMTYYGSLGNAELIHHHQKQIRAAQARDTVLSLATDPEIERGTNNKFDPGMVWDGKRFWDQFASQLSEIQQLPPSSRALLGADVKASRSMDEAKGAFEKVGVGWKTEYDGWQSFSGAAEHTVDARSLSHLSRDSQAGMTTVARMNAEARRFYGR